MLVSKNWLQEYIKEKLPDTETLAETLSLHAFEVEGVEKVGGLPAQAGDEVLDIDVLPNRAHDSLGHWGVAKEICALFDLTFKQPDIKSPTEKGLKSADTIELSVEDSKLVPRATKRLVIDVKVAESPKWLKEKLAALGQKSINNIVDATNFVTFETSQPVHAFDYDKLAGTKKKITIRGAKKREKVETLDGDTFELEEGMLVISDEEKALDIAGIKGGANSGINEDTKKIVLSVCNFDQTKIRKTSQALGLVTEASKRFGQGLSAELPAIAMERLSQLVHELAGGKVAEDVLDKHPRPRNPYKLGVSLSEVNKILGAKISDKEVENILNRLGFEHEKVKPVDRILEFAPKFESVPYKLGSSISYDAPKTFDCSAFTSYVFAHAGVQLPRISVEQFLYTIPVDEKDLKPGDLVFSKGKKPYFYKETPKGVGHCGIYLGEGKVIHASGSKGKMAVVIEDFDKSKFNGGEFRGFRRVPGIEEERFVITVPHERLDLHSGYDFLVSGNKQDLIEEIGRVYGYDNIKATVPEVRKKPKVFKEFYYANKIRDILVNEGFSEVYTYSFADKGEVELANPFGEDRPFLRSSLRSTNADVLERGERYKDLFGQEVIKVFEIGKVFTKKGEYMSLIIGVAGMDEKKGKDFLKETEKILGEAVGTSLRGKSGKGVLEINLSELLEKLPEPKSYDDLAIIDSSEVQFKPLSQFPFVLRDIAIWVPGDTNSSEVEKLIREKAGDLLEQVRLFDEYKKDDRTSYAFRLVFQSYEKTLSDEEVNKIMEQIYAVVKKKDWEVR